MIRSTFVLNQGHLFTVWAFEFAIFVYVRFLGMFFIHTKTRKKTHPHQSQVFSLQTYFFTIYVVFSKPGLFHPYPLLFILSFLPPYFQILLTFSLSDPSSFSFHLPSHPVIHLSLPRGVMQCLLSVLWKCQHCEATEACGSFRFPLVLKTDRQKQ